MTSAVLSGAINRQIVFVSRPDGTPCAENFELRSAVRPEPRAGEALIQMRWLSIDGFMVGRLRGEGNYTAGVALGEVMHAFGVGVVAATNRADRSVGDFVFGPLGMQEWAIEGPDLPTRKLDPHLAPVQSALGVLGISGWSAYFGLLEIARPTAGETVAVSAGTGAVGALVGQIARLKGCKTIAIVGSEEKADEACSFYGYTRAVVHRSPSLAQDLVDVSPDGIDVYFDNVGGDIYEAVLPRLNNHGRVVVCGRLATAHLADTSLDHGPRDHNTILVKRLRKEGFIVSDFADRFDEATSELARWVSDGKVILQEDVVDGLERAPEALERLLSGKNRGKQLVRLG